ncbi:MAG: alpha/beta hydrolase, partial [Parvularculaceae bacterium]|nr:alpha/beta hydrolase [Parvularculaceae bacterium]
YRNFNRNWEMMRSVDPVIRKPCLFIGAELDIFLPIELSVGMPDLIPDLEMKTIAGCGHWVMWERPAELNTLLVDWLVRRRADLV